MNLRGNKSILKWSGIFFSLLSLFGGLWIYFSPWNDRTSLKAPLAMKPHWELAIDEIVSVWEQGVDTSDPYFLSQCPEFKSVTAHPNKELSSCSYSLFKCFYSNRKNKVRFKNHWYPYRVEISEPTHQRENLKLKLIMGEETLPLTLENNCNKASLPQGYYLGQFYKSSNKIKDRLWHTSKVNYVVDKYLVRNFEVIHWAKRKGLDQILDKLSKSDPFEPVIHLLSEQMENFCKDHNSEVLTAKIHDALTYHHGRQSWEEIKTTPPSLNSAPHPFGPRKDDGPQFKEKFEKEGCQKVYSKECLEKKVEKTFPSSMGWSGVAELLGGPMEYVANPYRPRRNLVVSSYYFDFNSSWHQAGQLGYWNGQDFGKMNFNFFGEQPVIDPSKKVSFHVGFRCMRKTYGGEKP